MDVFAADNGGVLLWDKFGGNNGWLHCPVCKILISKEDA